MLGPRVSPTCGLPGVGPRLVGRTMRRMTTSDPSDPGALQRLLDALPPPAEPLDVVMADGFLCAVLLRDDAGLTPARWLPFVFDIEGRPLAPPERVARARQAVLLRHRALQQAIVQRQWFDPWMFELDDGAAPAEAVMPWAAGFALAAERFALPLAATDPAGVEALALIYQYLDADDWPAAMALSAAIGELEPPRTLADAVEDLVRGVLLLADRTGPAAATPARRSTRR